MRRLLGTLALTAAVAACADSTAPRDIRTSMQPGEPLLNRSSTPGIAPRQSRPHGKSYEEWGGALLQWGSAIPAAVNPFVDQTGALTQAAESGKVWFLMGPSELAGQPQKASLTMPPGTAIFVSPLANYAAGPGGISGDGNDTPEQLRDLAKILGDFITGVQVELDGVPVADMEQYRMLSPTVPLNTPNDNIYSTLFGEPNPFTFGNLAGFGLFINPLPPGVHVIHAVSAVPAFGLSFDITYTITVSPGR